MRNLLPVAVLTAVIVIGPGLSAQEDLVGKPAPDFSVGQMLYDSEVLAKSLDDCRGEVILIKYWGLKCGPCKAAMPGLQRLWEEYRYRGLHIFHVESQNHTADEIRAYCEKMGYHFPQTLREGETDFGAYPGPGSLPYGYLIGAEGKVIWQGRRGYEEVIADEIPKIRYPGLGKSEVSR
jgi:thiol-disulfide isomerase/thioredoxin